MAFAKTSTHLALEMYDSIRDCNIISERAVAVPRESLLLGGASRRDL